MNRGHENIDGKLHGEKPYAIGMFLKLFDTIGGSL